MFRRKKLPPSSGHIGLKIEAVCSSETLVCTYKSTRRHYPEDQIRRLSTLLQNPAIGSYSKPDVDTASLNKL
jgi:hypothetical protein